MPYRVLACPLIATDGHCGLAAGVAVLARIMQWLQQQRAAGAALRVPLVALVAWHRSRCCRDATTWHL